MIDRSWEDAITLLLWEKGVSRCLFWQQEIVMLKARPCKKWWNLQARCSVLDALQRSLLSSITFTLKVES